jgi:hypothetical protein
MPTLHSAQECCFRIPWVPKAELEPMLDPLEWGSFPVFQVIIRRRFGSRATLAVNWG